MSLVDYFGKTLWKKDVIPGFKMRNRIMPLIIKIMELMMKINNLAIKVNRN